MSATRLLLVAALLGCALPAAARPAPWPQPALGPSSSGGPEVLFTFDDGPDEATTPKILEALRPYGIKTIFFEVGRRTGGERPGHVRRRAVQQEVLKDGHILGNHTLHHVHLCLIPDKQQDLEMDGQQALLAHAMGMEPVFFRAPYGDRCPRLERALAERGWKNVHWDLDPMEWQSNSSDEVFDYLVQKLKKLDGRAVILLHDTKWAAVHALPRVLAWIQAENQRRDGLGLAPIRLLSYTDIARERIPAAVQGLVDGGVSSVLAFFPTLTRRLILPLTGTYPVAVASPGRRSVPAVATAAAGSALASPLR